MSQHTAAIFQVELSPCCAHRVRVTLGDKKLCLSWREARRAARALKDLGQQADRSEKRGRP